MRTLTRAFVVYSLLLFSAHAFADVILVKADNIGTADDELMVTHHRYETAINKLNNDSDQITGKILNRHRQPANENSKDNMKVTLIKIKR